MTEKPDIAEIAMPSWWLAHLPQWLSDNSSPKFWPVAAERHARLARRWGVLRAEDWRRLDFACRAIVHHLARRYASTESAGAPYAIARVFILFGADSDDAMMSGFLVAKAKQSAEAAKKAWWRAGLGWVLAPMIAATAIWATESMWWTVAFAWWTGTVMTAEAAAWSIAAMKAAEMENRKEVADEVTDDLIYAILNVVEHAIERRETGLVEEEKERTTS